MYLCSVKTLLVRLRNKTSGDIRVYDFNPRCFYFLCNTLFPLDKTWNLLYLCRKFYLQGKICWTYIDESDNFWLVLCLNLPFVQNTFGFGNIFLWYFSLDRKVSKRSSASRSSNRRLARATAPRSDIGNITTCKDDVHRPYMLAH